MKLIINSATVIKGGSLQVAISFLNECKEIYGHEYHIFLGKAIVEQIDTDIFPQNFHFYHVPFRPSRRLFHYHSASRLFGKLENQIKPDCVFTIGGPAYWRPTVPHLVGYNLPHYIYPESNFFRIISWRERLLWRLKKIILLNSFKSEADAYVVETDEVGQRLSRLLKTDKVITVSNSLSSYYFNPFGMKNKLPEKNRGEIRLLTLSAYYRHKNLSIIIKVIKELKKIGIGNIKFILTIPQNIYDLLFGDKYKLDILNVGPVKAGECPSLYKECDMVFLPTLLECFSAVYPEAMMMGKPILTSDLDFARSICDDAAEYFNPLNAKDIADKIVALVNNNKRQKELVAKGKIQLKQFKNAKEKAKAYLSICESLVKK